MSSHQKDEWILLDVVESAPRTVRAIVAHNNMLHYKYVSTFHFSVLHWTEYQQMKTTFRNNELKSVATRGKRI